MIVLLNQLYFIKTSLEAANISVKADPIYQDFRQGDVRHSQADISKAKNLLGYNPDFNISEGIHKQYLGLSSYMQRRIYEDSCNRRSWFYWLSINKIHYKNSSHEVVNPDKLTYARNINNLAQVSNNERYMFESSICNQAKLHEVFVNITQMLLCI